jgi:hypothetical protein
MMSCVVAAGARQRFDHRQSLLKPAARIRLVLQERCNTHELVRGTRLAHSRSSER